MSLSIATDPIAKVPEISLAVATVVSMLHQRAEVNAATRVMNESSVLSQTLGRLAAMDHQCACIVLAWDDQIDAIVAAVPGVAVKSIGPRKPSAFMRETDAALRWADGWRGALLGKTTFDRGFDAAAILAVLDDTNCDAALLIDPSACRIDVETLDRLIAHLASLPEQAYAFAPGAVGSGAMLIRRNAVAALSAAGRGSGSLLAYHPDRPEHDPMAKAFAVVVPPRVARTTASVAADSARQIARLSLIQADGVEPTIAALETQRAVDPMPRDVVLELTTRRSTKPVWSMLRHQTVERCDLERQSAKVIFEQLASVDDVRLTLAGVGDPLLHPHWPEIVTAAKDAGIAAIHIETDLLPTRPDDIQRLAASEIDAISIHLPAAHAVTYAHLMGVDRMREALENIKALLFARRTRNSGVPIIVPTFVKLEANLGEMEAWYDQWLRAVGVAVIAAPSDFSGRIEYGGVADMIAGRRRACRRLASRLTILCDGSVASCEEDVLGEQRCGKSDAIADGWRDRLAMLRLLHAEHRWDESHLCRSCRMWDRP